MCLKTHTMHDHPLRLSPLYLAKPECHVFPMFTSFQEILGRGGRVPSLNQTQHLSVTDTQWVTWKTTAVSTSGLDLLFLATWKSVSSLLSRTCQKVKPSMRYHLSKLDTSSSVESLAFPECPCTNFPSFSQSPCVNPVSLDINHPPSPPFL